MKQKRTGEQPKNYKRKNKRKIKKSTKVLLLIMLGYLVFQYVSLEIQYQNLAEHRDELKADIKVTEEHQQQLLEQVETSKSDKYIEKLARRYFGLVYPNEKVYIEREVEMIDKEE